MKIAILSDIHGNSDALMSVLTDIKKIKIKHLLIAGDFVGYYYNIKKVLSLLEEWEVDAIGGNHESLLLDWVNDHNRDFIGKKYGSSIQQANNTLTAKQIKWLTTLSKSKEFVFNGKTVLLCHGSPWSEDAYIYPDSDQSIIDKIFLKNKDIVIYGHTHYPVVHKKRSQIIVNPGSVGQTRDKIPGACWALWNTETHDVTLKRSNYNTETLIKQCQTNDPELTYLQNVLTRKNEN